MLMKFDYTATGSIRMHPPYQPTSHYLTAIIALFAGITLSLSARAQDATIQLQFISFPKAADSKPVELLLGNGETLKIDLPSRDLSSTYEVPALSSWVLGNTIVNPDGKASFSVYGKTPSISANRQVILVLRKGAKNSDGMELIPMAATPSNFDGGSYFLYNATSVDIAGSIGTGKFSLKPGEYSLISPKPTKVKNDRKYAFAQIFYRKGEDIQPLFSSTWRFNDLARSMVFFYHDPVTKHLRLHTIRDYIKEGS